MESILGQDFWFLSAPLLAKKDKQLFAALVLISETDIQRLLLSLLTLHDLNGQHKAKFFHLRGAKLAETAGKIPLQQ